MEEEQLTLSQSTPEPPPEEPAAEQSATGILPELLEDFARRELELLNQTYGLELPELAALREEPEGTRVLALFERGVPLPDAYAVVHLAEITAKREQAAKQAALNAVNGRAHLRRTTGVPVQEAAVPAEVYEQYRAMMPGWSDSKIRRSYQEYKKGEM